MKDRLLSAILIGVALGVAGCGGAPEGVPSASGFAVSSASEAGNADRVAACAAAGNRATQVACLVPVAEDLLARAYAPVVESRGLTFARPTVVTDAAGAQTACGKLSQVSYCPQDGIVSLPLNRLQSIGDRAATEVEWGPESTAYFAEELTPEQLSQGGAYGAIMALSHEYGHHIQTLIGYEKVNADQMAAEPDKAANLSSEFELMADCFAGWTAAVLDKAGAYDVTPADQWAAVTALAEVGDDFMQENRGGAESVKPATTFNHGAANERANAWVEGVGLGLDKKEPYVACLAVVDTLIAGRSNASPSASATG